VRTTSHVDVGIKLGCRGSNVEHRGVIARR
jgi:hypothetical protein